MATAVLFNTLKFVRRLQEAGVSEKQAEAMSAAQLEVFSEVLDSTVATKGDVNDLKNVLKTDIKELESNMEKRFAVVDGELKLIKWMLALVTLVTVVPTLKKLLFP